MPRGGARPNSGPKPGSATKSNREIADKAAAEGLTPLEGPQRSVAGRLAQGAARPLCRQDPPKPGARTNGAKGSVQYSNKIK